MLMTMIKQMNWVENFISFYSFNAQILALLFIAIETIQLLLYSYIVIEFIVMMITQTVWLILDWIFYFRMRIALWSELISYNSNVECMLYCTCYIEYLWLVVIIIGCNGNTTFRFCCCANTFVILRVQLHLMIAHNTMVMIINSITIIVRREREEQVVGLSY